MSAKADPLRRAELRLRVVEVLNDLFPEDLAALLDSDRSAECLRDAAADQAEKILDKIAKTTTEPVLPQEYQLVIAACFTWSKNQAGIARNISHAAKKFLRYRRFAELPIGILVRTDRTIPDDDRVVALLARTLRIRAEVTRADQEPELILNMVVPAIVAALGRDSQAEGTLVNRTLDVLDRGARLVADYRITRQGVGTREGALPVAGNADFLVRIAAYRLAIEEHRGRVVAQPVDELVRAVAELSGILRRAMTRAVRAWNRRGPDEPDVATAFNQYAGYLGLACGDDTTRRAVGAVHSVLNYRLGLDEPPDVRVVDDLDALADSSQSRGEHVPPLSDVEHLVGWLIAALFRGAGPAARGPLLQWLDGRQVPNGPKDLPLLVRRLRVATSALDEAPESRPPLPAGITADQFRALTARLAAAVDPGGLKGDPRHDARYVALSALPPLWTVRRPVGLLVAAHLRVMLGQRFGGPRQATLLATHGVRAPVQFVQKSASPPLEPCCPDAAARPAPGDRPRQPVYYEDICPHRPWGEIGWVENYRTLGQTAGFSAESVRKRLRDYDGPWPELLWY